MMTEDEIRQELKRYPKFIREAIAAKEWYKVRELQIEQSVFETILEG